MFGAVAVNINADLKETQSFLLKSEPQSGSQFSLAAIKKSFTSWLRSGDNLSRLQKLQQQLQLALQALSTSLGEQVSLAGGPPIFQRLSIACRFDRRRQMFVLHLDQRYCKTCQQWFSL